MCVDGACGGVTEVLLAGLYFVPTRRATLNLIPGKYESATLILSIKSLRSFNMTV